MPTVEDLEKRIVQLEDKLAAMQKEFCADSVRVKWLHIVDDADNSVIRLSTLGGAEFSLSKPNGVAMVQMGYDTDGGRILVYREKGGARSITWDECKGPSGYQ